MKVVIAQYLELSRLNGVALPSSESSDFILPASFNVPDVLNSMAKARVNPSSRLSKSIIKQVEAYLNGHLPLGISILFLKTEPSQ